jgi:AraC family transcriptional regulator
MTGSAEASLPQPVRASPGSARSIGSSGRGEHPPRDIESAPFVDIFPSEIVKRNSSAWPGMIVETVEITRHKPFEYRFRAPCHLLIAAELAERDDGETILEGLPRSTLQDFTRKLTFVPAGHVFRGSQKPRLLSRTMYFYLDPSGPLADPALRFSEIEFKPRLFFFDRDLWEIALKLKSPVENPGSMHRQYAEALGILLTHEIIRINNGSQRRDRAIRGGLASWQQRRVADYIEEHIGDDIPLAALAELARLSPYHFCRSFKQSFGVPPHRFHAMRRIERAKQFLRNRELSVTAIALKVGFGETSTFTAAFHRLTGISPSHYRCSLE